MVADEARSSRTTEIAALVARYALVIVIAWLADAIGATRTQATTTTVVHAL
jgi:hypothetical protein